MSTKGEGEVEGEQSPRHGEGIVQQGEVVRQDRKLTFDEASKCLNTLGKDESAMRYAYLKMSATDRKLTDVRIIMNFRHLLFVDVSGNYLNLDALQALSELPFVIQIQAQRNFVDGANLNLMPYLQDLSLARNLIKDTKGISQPELVYLDLNYNQIYEAYFENEELPNLKELEMRGNFLFEFAGNFPWSVEKLFLAENRISRVLESDIYRLRNLQVLHLRNNLIRKLNGFTNDLSSLKYLNLRQNKITKKRQFRKLQGLSALETLIILENPVSGGEEKAGEDDEKAPDDDEEMGEEHEPLDPNRLALLVLLPSLKRINKVPVSYDEKAEAIRKYDTIYSEIMEELILNKFNTNASEILTSLGSDEEVDVVTTTTEYLTELDVDDAEDEFADLPPDV